MGPAVYRAVAASRRSAAGRDHTAARTKGTPQGGVISPLLANLFLHYAFDLWMERNYSQLRFER